MQKNSLPPLSAFVDEQNPKNITGNVQVLLDFALIGHSRTGQRALHQWLSRHDELHLVGRQITSLQDNEPHKLVKKLHRHYLELQEQQHQTITTANNIHYQQGYQSENDIQFDDSLALLRNYWPQTKLIIGVRNPIDWYDSMLRKRKQQPKRIPPHLPPTVLYHLHLNMLGKVNVSSETEHFTVLTLLSLVWLLEKHSWQELDYPYMPNQVFLYDVSQPFDPNVTRREQFRNDLSRFLNVTTPLPPITTVMEDKSPPQHRISLQKLCLAKYSRFRQQLLTAGRSASLWIRSHFVHHPDVTVSSPTHFERILKSWYVDPCIDIAAAAGVAVSSTVDSRNTSSEWYNQHQPLIVASNNRTTSDSISATEVDASSIIPWSMADEEYPPLETVIQNGEIVGDINFVLDFAIVGHSKTGTTTLMAWMSHHPQILIHPEEMHGLTKNRPVQFVQKLYLFPPGRQYIRGYKAPADLMNDAPRALLRQYFPRTKLIVGVRHPVKWFESYYNFKARKGYSMPPPETLVGPDLPRMVRFHVNLGLMGKTNVSFDLDQQRLILPYLAEYGANLTHLERMNNPIFLYDIAQPFDVNATRQEQFRNDLADYLALPLGGRLSEHLKPRKVIPENYHIAMEICDANYTNLRNELVEVGRAAAAWILDYFLPLPDVTVSSVDFFREQLLTWQFDPCDHDHKSSNAMEFLAKNESFDGDDHFDKDKF